MGDYTRETLKLSISKIALKEVDDEDIKLFSDVSLVFFARFFFIPKIFFEVVFSERRRKKFFVGKLICRPLPKNTKRVGGYLW